MFTVVDQRLTFVAAALVAAACNTSSPDSCKVTCATDVDCPGDQTCGELGLCTGGEACPCEPGEFRGCDGDAARFCNATADGLEAEACAAGCNADAGRCNLCVPSADACVAEGTVLETCGADGLPASTSACRLPCVPEGAGGPAHCGYLEPLFFPDLCDALATSPEVTLAEVTLDTSADATCNGGILMQTGGPEVCVIRNSKITIGDNVVVNGGRAVAFVADEAVLVQGLLDISANGTTSGPAGGAPNGDRAGTNKGGGGAGFGEVGGAGGAGDGGFGAAGTAIDPLQTLIFAGGTSPALPTTQQSLNGYPYPGGAGGGAMLVACRGDVAVSGTIDAGGGGGKGGRDTNPSTSVNNVGGAGGGSGGYVVLQGIEVRVTSAGVDGIFANGGSGAGSCAGDACVGGDGNDALRSTSEAGAGLSDNGGIGGAGGALLKAAQAGGASTTSPGGGGGAVGRLQACHPDVGSVTISATTSPAFQPHVTITTR